MVEKKIEALLEDAFGYTPQALIDAAKRKEVPAEGPQDMVGIGANGSKFQKINPANYESNQVPNGLDMTGDNEGTGEAFTHADIVKALQGVHEQVNEDTSFRIVNGKVVRSVNGTDTPFASTPKPSAPAAPAHTPTPAAHSGAANPHDFGATDNADLLHKVTDHVTDNKMDEHVLGNLLGY
jgi:hypothetical protein